jgi:transposase
MKTREKGMLIKTLLNHVEKHKGFVYGRVNRVEQKNQIRLEVEIQARKNSKPICSRCNFPGPGYDRLPERKFEYVPLWGIAVYFVYAMRRVNCRRCGVTVETVPWAEGKLHLTRSFSWFLAVWASRLPWTQVANIFGTSWNRVYAAVSWSVSWGMEHRDLSGVTAIGVDEISYKKGHKYLTVVYQINKGCRRLLWIGRGRSEATLRGFFHWFGEERSELIEYVCSDMWKPYLNVVRDCATGAINILDRFHIMANMNKALDKVRRQETRKLKEQGKNPVLKNSRWCILKRTANLTNKQFTKLKDLLDMNLKTVKTYLLKEDFHKFWGYTYPANAGKFLDAWCTRTMRSKIEPMKDMARSLRSHRELLLNYFRAKKQFSSGAVEGLNNKIKTTARKSYGFRSLNVFEIALFQALGMLPLPPITHKFC